MTFEIELILNILRTLAVIGTFVIAWKAYDKFGLKSRVKDKEIQLVEQFRILLRNTTIPAKTKDIIAPFPLNNKVEVTYQIHPSENMGTFIKESNKDKQVLFTNLSHKYLSAEISGIVEDFRFPKKLLKEFHFMNHDISRVTLDHKVNLENAVYVGGIQQIESDTIDPGTTFIKKPLNIEEMTWEVFINNIENLVRETDNFLIEHGYTEI